MVQQASGSLMNSNARRVGASAGRPGLATGRCIAGALLLSLLGFGNPAIGQAQPQVATAASLPDATAAAPKQQSATANQHKIGPLDFSVSWRLRAEGWDWFEGATGENSYVFPHSLLRVGIGQQTERLDWQVEGAQDAILALPAGAIVPAPQGQLGLGGTYYAANGNQSNDAYVFVKQAYLRIKGIGHGSLRLGRFEYLDGTELKPKDPTLDAVVQTRFAQRLVGNFGWAAVGRSFDGLQFSYNLDRSNFTFVGARPTRGVFQVDGNGSLDVDLYYGAWTVPVASPKGGGDLRLFALGYVDHRTLVLKTDNRPSAVRAADHDQIRIATFGGNYAQVINTAASGKFDFLFWGALQTGSWGQLTHRAGAFVTEFGWQPPISVLKPWLSLGYSFGSGDGNPSDSRHTTFFQVLPTPRPYARFPFYDMLNNEDAYGSVVLRPLTKLSLRSELHALRLNRAQDLWYLGGGAFQPRTFGYVGRPSGGSRSLANTWDLSADYQLTRSFSVNLYYGYAWGKGVVSSIYSRDRSGQFGYIETNLRY
jgi:Alginate export